MKTICLLCKGELGDNNKSGYCTKCYSKSPQYLAYQRIKQKEFYYKYKERKRAYYQRPEIKAKQKVYMKEYNKEHKERLSKQKKDWAIKQKEKLNGN